MKKNINRIGKNNSNKKKTLIIISIIVLAILIGLFFFINMLIPIKDVTEENMKINLSTTKITGNSVTATLSPKSKSDIFYFIDYSAGEELYYDNEEFTDEVEEISNQSNNTTTETNNTISKTTNNSISNNISNNTNNLTSNNTSNNTNNSTSNNTSNNTNSLTNTDTSTTKKVLDIKQISDNEYKKVKNSKIEIQNNGIVYLKYGRFGKLSSIPYVFEVSNIDKTGPEIGEIETESTAKTVTVKVSAIDETPSNLQYYFRLADANKYFSNGSNNTYTFTDLTPDESYTIFIKVADKFGNESEAVTEATASTENIPQTQTVVEKKIYHFKVNLGANTVTVYEKDSSGKFTEPVKAFICSTGKSTPKSGTYKISDRYRWRSLFGNVYGQYAVRIHGNILFHSVPYEQMYANTLEYEEYDKLGTSASMGCVRLCVKDAKWIYDNAKNGSTVEFYSDSSNPGPLGKPKAQKISDNKANRNWDPTDPDKHNPWLGGDGSVTKVTVVDTNPKKTENKVETPSSNNISNNTLNDNTSNTTNSSNTTSNTTNTLIINDVISDNWD